jgi:hypothetical protein
MLNIKMFGDKLTGERGAVKYVWSIVVMDSRRTLAETDGSSDTEQGAKIGMLSALTSLVAKLDFSPIDDQVDEGTTS